MMGKQPLGKLEKVDLRTYWPNEARDFTPWLASPENIRLLGEAVKLDLEVVAQEKEVGPFYADILCKDTGSEGWVLIENQLEPTNHTHLGQVVTYAAGLNASMVIWIAERFTNEHRAALDWLNEITNDELSFFGIEVELWKIGESLSAPKFNLVSTPNDWSKSVQSSARQGELSEAKKLQYDFWLAFRKYMEENSPLRPQKPRPQHWINVSAGRLGCHFACIASTWDSEAEEYTGELRVELILDSEDSKTFFAQLEAQRGEIEKQIGQSLTWHNPPDKRMCRIYIRQSSDVQDRGKWAEFHAWLKDKVELFHRVLTPSIKALEVGE